VVAPGVYDAVGARLVEAAGFDCAYLTGAGLSMAGFGLPDLGLVSFGEVAERVAVIADSTELPLVVDGDTGYGGVLNVARTVWEFEKRGAAGIQLEDQVFPKRCGHEAKRTCIPAQEMVDKVHAALDTRRDDDFLVIARTDARTSEGLDSAIERALVYAEAGADVVFVESPESEEEMRQICEAVPGPSMANMVEGGRTPLLSSAQLEEIGYALAIFPNSILRLVCRQVERLLVGLRSSGTTTPAVSEMLSHGELFGLFEFPEWVRLEERFIPPSRS
jgi:2-methylisocitrate lyase-like PEP mutase family enzyme